MEKASTNGRDLPIDLLLEIFSRLPAKTVAKCRCLSKPWASMIRLPSFTELFLTKSSARPRLLFACHDNVNNEVLFFSSTQPQEKYPSLLTATYYMKIPYNFWFERFSPIRGLVFLRDKREDYRLSVICNPGTGQYFTLPKLNNGVISYFGYDPVEKQYKVLSMAANSKGGTYEHQVLTLGNGVGSWRRIKCCIPHSLTSRYNHICINGVLYYTAFNSAKDLIIVCFDVKSEKFSFIKYMKKLSGDFGVTPLINCNDKVGSLESGLSSEFVIHGRRESITLWVLEDVEKQKWSKHIYVLPASWQNVVGDRDLRLVGVTQTKEIVLSALSRCESYCIFYFNTEREMITKVEIQEMNPSEGCNVYAHLDYVEDVTLMQNV